MRRILFSLFTIFTVVALMSGATWALLSDDETATDNTFAAGTIDLKTNNADGVSSAYTLTNIKPGAWDLAGQVILKNAGTTKGHVWYEIVNVRNYENTCIEPETSDTTCGTGADQGELGVFAKASIQANVSPWTRYPSSGILPINSAAGVRYDIKDMDPGETLPLVVYGVWTSTSSDNLAQGDSVMFDIVFHLEQI